MDIQLIQGEFSSSDALELIKQMMHIKVMYHENKIAKHSNEEEIKSRESKIKRLQKDLYEFRTDIVNKKATVKLNAIIKIEYK